MGFWDNFLKTVGQANSAAPQVTEAQQNVATQEQAKPAAERAGQHADTSVRALRGATNPAAGLTPAGRAGRTPAQTALSPSQPTQSPAQRAALTPTILPGGSVVTPASTPAQRARNFAPASLQPETVKPSKPKASEVAASMSGKGLRDLYNGTTSVTGYRPGTPSVPYTSSEGTLFRVASELDDMYNNTVKPAWDAYKEAEQAYQNGTGSYQDLLTKRDQYVNIYNVYQPQQEAWANMSSGENRSYWDLTDLDDLPAAIGMYNTAFDEGQARLDEMQKNLEARSSEYGGLQQSLESAYQQLQEAEAALRAGKITSDQYFKIWNEFERKRSSVVEAGNELSELEGQYNAAALYLAQIADTGNYGREVYRTRYLKAHPEILYLKGQGLEFDSSGNTVRNDFTFQGAVNRIDELREERKTADERRQKKIDEEIKAYNWALQAGYQFANLSIDDLPEQTQFFQDRLDAAQAELEDLSYIEQFKRFEMWGGDPPVVPEGRDYYADLERYNELQSVQADASDWLQKIKNRKYELTYESLLETLPKELQEKINTYIQTGGYYEDQTNGGFWIHNQINGPQVVNGNVVQATTPGTDEALTAEAEIRSMLEKEGFDNKQIADILYYATLQANEARTNSFINATAGEARSTYALADWIFQRMLAPAKWSGAVSATGQTLFGGPDSFTGEAAPVDYYNDANLAAHAFRAVGQGVAARTIDWLSEVYGVDSDDERVQLEAKILNGAYNLTGSMADSTITKFLSLAGGDIGLLIMSSGAATDAMIEMHEKGYSDEAVFTSGVVAGIAEFWSEHANIDELMGIVANAGTKGVTFSDVMRFLRHDAVRQGLSEGAEEVFSDIVNTVYDETAGKLFNGGLTQIRYDALQKQREDPGLSWDDAVVQSWKEWVLQSWEDLLGGFLSGYGMAGIGAAGGYVFNNQATQLGESVQGNGVHGDNTYKLIQDTRNLPSQKAAEAAGLTGDLGRGGAYHAGRTLSRYMDYRILEAAEARLKELGVSDERITPDLLHAIDAAAGGSPLSPTEKSALRKSAEGQQVMRELQAYRDELRSAEEEGRAIDIESQEEWAINAEAAKELTRMQYTMSDIGANETAQRVSELERQYQAAQAENPDATVMTPMSKKIESNGASPEVAVKQGKLLDKVFSGSNLTNKEMRALDLNNKAVRDAFIERTGMTGIPDGGVSDGLKRIYVNQASRESRLIQERQAALKEGASQLDELNKQKSAERTEALKAEAEKNRNPIRRILDNLTGRKQRRINAANRQADARAMAVADASNRFSDGMAERDVVDLIRRQYGVMVDARSIFEAAAARDLGKASYDQLSATEQAAIAEQYDQYLGSLGLPEPAVRALDNAVRGTAQVANVGEVVFDGSVDQEKLRQDAFRQSQVTILTKLAKALGLKIYLYESQNVQGMWSAVTDAAVITTDNGWFDRRDGSIHLDINAGENGQGVILFTAAHELTHLIKAGSPERFEVLKKFLFDRYRGYYSKIVGKSSDVVEDLIKAQIRKIRNQGRAGDYTPEQLHAVAEEEVVADSFEIMLAGEDAAKALIELSDVDAELGDEIIGSLRNLYETIRETYKDLDPDSTEAKMAGAMEGAFDELRGLWIEGLSDATSHYAAKALTGSGGRVSKQTAEDLASVGSTISKGIVISRDLSAQIETEDFSKPEDPIEHSIRTLPQWASQYGEDDRARVALESLAAAMTANEAIMGYVPTGEYAYSKMGPLRKNVEYVVTFDMDASCPRTFQFVNYRNALQRIAGRPLTDAEAMNLMFLMRRLNQQIPCTYCYVENKRILKNQSYLNYFAFRSAVMSAESDEEALKKMYSYDEKKGTVSAAAKKVFDEWRFDVRNGAAFYPSAQECWTGVQTAKNSVFNWLDQQREDGKIQYGQDVKKPTSTGSIIDRVCRQFGVTDKLARAEIEGFVKKWQYDTLAGVKHVYDIPNDPSVSEVNQDYLQVHRIASNYASSASSARTVDDYVPYTDQLKNIEHYRQHIMSMGGIRKHSSNDFRMDYVLDYLQFYADLAAGKWTGHTYTKSVDFCKVFGRSGDRINLSIAMNTENGKIVENQQEGAAWRDARELREAYPDIGTMAMVTDNAQLSFALNSDWIDMIIPFHASGLPKAVWYNVRAWYDYTSVQLESFYTVEDMKQRLDSAGVSYKGLDSEGIKDLFRDTFEVKEVYNADGTRVRPHFLPDDDVVIGPNGERQIVPGHHNDAQRYRELCEEYGVHPRFYGIQVTDADGNMIDVTEHPHYDKLIKETSRTDSEQRPIEFNFDEYDPYLGMTPIEYALQRMGEEAKIGGYANTAKDPMGIIPMFEEMYLNQDREIGWLPDASDDSDGAEKLRAVMEYTANAYKEMYDADMRTVDTEGYQRKLLGDSEVMHSVRGVRAQDANLDELRRAEEMGKDGANWNSIRQETGWYSGKEATRRSSRGYDYSKSFGEQIDDYIAGVHPKGDTLVVGETPQALRDIGFAALPMTYATGHLRDVIDIRKDLDSQIADPMRDVSLSDDDWDHSFGVSVLKDLPRALEHPFAVIRSEREPDSSVVVFTEFSYAGKPMIAAFKINGVGKDNGDRFDSYAITSFYRARVATKMLNNAIDEELKGQVAGVYYLDKEKAAGVADPSKLTQLGDSGSSDGLYHKITDSKAEVNPKIRDNTNTLQFKRWFAGSKLVNQDGTPMVLYHQTGADNAQRTGVGYVVTTEAGDGAREVYARLRKPFKVNAAAGATDGKSLAKQIIQSGSLRNFANRAAMQGRIGMVAAMTNEADANDELASYLRSLGYDGIQFNDGTALLFNENQIKATDNIGLYSQNSDNLRYSGRGAQDRSYNVKGVQWAFAEGAITEQQESAFYQHLAEINKLGYSALTTKAGEDIFYTVGDKSPVVIISNGDYRHPVIDRIYRISREGLSAPADADIIRELILDAEQNFAAGRAAEQVRADCEGLFGGENFSLTTRWDSEAHDWKDQLRKGDPRRAANRAALNREVTAEEVIEDLEDGVFSDPEIGEVVKRSARANQADWNPLRDENGKSVIVYKAFYAMDGKLYPPMISNLSDTEKKKIKNAVSGTLTGLDTPVGVILDAEVGELARYKSNATEYDVMFRKLWKGSSKAIKQVKAELTAEGYNVKTGLTADAQAAAEAKMEKVFPQLKKASKEDIVEHAGELIRNESGRLAVVNSKGGGTLAFRPGWHLGEWPNLTQFDVKDPVTGKDRSAMPDSLVFCACEIAGDIDYQLDAMELGMTANGGFDRTQAGLPYIPVDGYYKYRTNADPTTAPWYITGAIKVVAILDDEDCRRICAQYGITPQPRVSHQDIDLAKYGLKRGPVTAPSIEELQPYTKSQAAIRNEEALREALADPAFQEAYVSRKINFDDAEIKKEFARNGQDPEYYRERYTQMGDPETRYSSRNVQNAQDAVSELDKRYGKGTSKNLEALVRKYQQRAENAQKQLELERAQRKLQERQFKKDLLEAKRITGQIQNASSKALRVANNELNRAKRENQRRVAALEKKMADLAVDTEWRVGLAKSDGEQKLKAQKRFFQDKLNYNAKTDRQWARGIANSRESNARKEERRVAKSKLDLQRKVLSLPGSTAVKARRKFNSHASKVAMINDKSSVYTPINFGNEADSKLPKTATEFREKMTDLYGKFYRAMVNDVAELDNMAKLQTRTDSLSVMINVLRASSATPEMFYHTGMVDKNGNIVGPSFEELLLCHDANGKFDPQMQAALQDYMYHKHNVDRMSLEKRAIERVQEFVNNGRQWLLDLTNTELAQLAAEGNRTVREYVQLMQWANSVKNKAVMADADNYAVTAESSQAVCDTYERETPWLKEKAEEIYKYWDIFMREWAVGTSISATDYEEMRQLYPHYVPTYRVQAGQKARVTNTSNGIVTGEMIKGAKGSTKELLSLEDQFVKSMQNIVQGARLNDVSRNLIEELLFDDEGVFSDFGVYDWDNASEAFKQTFWDFDDEQSQQRIEKITLDGKEVYRISCWVDGVKMSAYVNRAMFEGMQSLAGRNNEIGNAIAKVGRKVTAPMKGMITGYNPFFAAKNIIRDQHTAMTNSMAGAAYWKYLGRAAALMNQNADEWVNFQALGGVSSNETRMDGGFAKAMQPGSGVKQAANWTKEKLGTLGDLSESVSRFAEYLAVVDMLGGDTYENRLAAIRAAAEVTVDFGRGGSWGRVINAWVPYWNANVQGLDKMIRNIAEQPDFVSMAKRLGRAGLVNVIPAALQAAIIHALGRWKDYEELSDQQKDNYYCIPVPGKEHKFVKLPKSQDWAAFISTPFIRAMEGVNGRDDPWEGWFESAVMPNMPFDTRTVLGVKNVPVLLPIGLDWALELAENKNYAGSAIIPYNLQDVSAKEQFDADTSLLAYYFGQIFKGSPMALDYIINDYMGNFWGVLAKSLPVSPLASRGMFTGETPVAEKLADMNITIASPFITDNRASNSTMAAYYDMLNELEQEVLDAGAHGDKKDAEHYKIYEALTQSGGYVGQIKAITAEAREHVKGEEQNQIRWEAVGLADLAMEFVEKCLSGEIKDPELWMTYAPYGDTILAEAESLKKYESANDGDFNFNGNLGKPKTIWDRTGDTDLKYDLSENPTAQQEYNRLRAEEYKKALETIIRSADYESLSSTEQAARLEKAKQAGLKKADQRMLEYLRESGIKGETITKTDYSAEERAAAYSVSWLMGEQGAYKPELTDEFVSLYDYNDQYSFIPSESTKKTFKDQSDTGKVYVLNTAQQKKYAEVYHDTITKAYTTVMQSAEYKAAGAELRAAMLARAKTYANDEIKAAFDAWLKTTGATATTQEKASPEISLEAKYAVQRALGDDHAMSQTVTDELIRLYQYSDVGEVQFFPIVTAPKKYVDDQNKGQMWVLTEDQREVYMAMMFDIYQRNIKKVMDSPRYKQSTDYEQAQMLCDVRDRLSGETQAEFKHWLRQTHVPTVSRTSPEAQAVQADIERAGRIVDQILGSTFRTYKDFSEGRGYTQPKKKKRK